MGFNSGFKGLMDLNLNRHANFLFSLFHWMRKVLMKREEIMNFCQSNLSYKEHKHNSMSLLTLAGSNVNKE